MFRSIALSVLLVTLVTGATVPEAEGNIKAEVVLIKDASHLPEGAQLIPIPRSQTKGIIRYTLGNRVSNDRLVSQASDYYQWATAQNVQLQLQYPASGTGATISFVEITVNQSSDVGAAYVLAGGIGQRNILILVEAYNTLWFNYVSKIYGK